jgi:hypothetical protein
MVEHQLKGLCYNCDEKYFPGHKCKEHKKFMAISEDVVDEEAKVSPVEDLPPTDAPTPPSDPPEVEPLISLACPYWLLCSPNPQAHWLH